MSLAERQPADLPKGWATKDLSPDTADVKREPPTVVRVPMRRFPGSRATIEASRPIVVRIAWEDGGFQVESASLHIYAYGGSVEEAVRDFVEQVVYFFFWYRDLPEEEVTGAAIDIKRTYDVSFSQVGE